MPLACTRIKTLTLGFRVQHGVRYVIFTELYVANAAL